MPRIALLLCPVLLLCCHSGAPRAPRKDPPRTALEYVPAGVDGLISVDVKETSKSALGMALTPILRATRLYRRFTLQSGVDILSQSSRLIVASQGLGTPQLGLLFILEGSFDIQAIKETLFEDKLKEELKPTTVYVIQENVGFAFPRPDVIFAGSPDLVRDALLVALHQKPSAPESYPMKDLLASRQEAIKGAILLPPKARERLAGSFQKSLEGAWAFGFAIDLSKETIARSWLWLSSEEKAEEAANLLAPLLPSAEGLKDPLFYSIASTLTLNVEGSALAFSFSLNHKAIDRLQEHSYALLGGAIGSFRPSKPTRESEAPSQEM